MYYFQELSDNKVTLVTDDDVSLWTFNNIHEAYTICRELYDWNPEENVFIGSQDINCSICAI